MKNSDVAKDSDTKKKLDMKIFRQKNIQIEKYSEREIFRQKIFRWKIFRQKNIWIEEIQEKNTQI